MLALSWAGGPAIAVLMILGVCKCVRTKNITREEYENQAGRPSLLSVWQMWTPARRPIIFADVPWTEALDHPGAFQMGFVRRLFDSRPFQKLVPCQTMVLDGPRSGAGKIRAARARDGSFAFVYSPAGEKFTVDQSVVKGARLKEIWYDPRYGVAREIHTGTSKAIQTYTPPNAGRGCDWILVLEDEAEKFPPPGPVR